MSAQPNSTSTASRASYAPLTYGLKHVTKTSELQPGQVYIVRFKNALRNYRTDIWICVILPEGFEPARGLSRRPRGARPIEEGSVWTTSLNERVYPTYLPGRNLFRWTHITDLFVLDKRPPRVYAEGSDRSESAMFRELLDIANGNPGLDYWKEMASRETQAKGKRGRQLKLLLPDNDDDSSDEDLDTDSDNGSSSGGESDTAPAELKFPGESSSSPTYTQGGSNPQAGSKRTLAQASLETGSQRPAALRRTQPAVPLIQPTSYRRNDNISNSSTTERAPKIEDEGKEKTDLFTLDLRSALGHVFLQEKDADDILAISHDVVSIKKKPEFEHIRSWLTTHEFKPRLVQLQVNDQAIVSNNVPSQGSDDETSQDREIGDIKGIHRKYRLEAVFDSHDLRQTILSLGRLYLSIRHFAMDGLVELITLKLQVAWNSYPGISQLVPILDVASMAFGGGPARNDALRTWLVSFIADTQDLYFYDCSPRFWEVMRSNRALHDEVFQKRTELHRGQPERYSDVLALLRSRGVEED